jgi:hypothetical protein
VDISTIDAASKNGCANPKSVLSADNVSMIDFLVLLSPKSVFILLATLVEPEGREENGAGYREAGSSIKEF